MNYKCSFAFILILWFNVNLSSQINPSFNKIAVDVSTQPQNASFDYTSCFMLGKDLGMTQVGLFQNWTSIETSPNTFNLSIFDIADYYYPLFNMSVDLTIVPIHTNNLEVPSDLTALAFNDPVMISRFNKLLDSIKSHLPNLTLSSLVIGSEHDVYLGSNSLKWSQYTAFYNSVSAHAKTLWPGLKVATELTFGGITSLNSYAQTLNASSDYIGVSYYPLNGDFTVKPVTSVSTDLSTLVNLYPSKPICFYQYGYPSSATCNSSEIQQAQFITETFAAWDTYSARIKIIDFTWLHDLDPAAVNNIGSYYGLTDPVFLEFLRTLGLRTFNGNGTDKLAFKELQCQAKQRGYNNLNIVCPTDINENEKEKKISLFPNPAAEKFTIECPKDVGITEVIISDIRGEIVMKRYFDKMELKLISINTLSSGLYLVSMHDVSGRKVHCEKLNIIK
ncbi:MAG: Beta-xylosidase [Bacteroidetes bacterium]|jgi:hypothetical protein|nr:Beta-xylosidase [Bacteroidota bacterium]